MVLVIDAGIGCCLPTLTALLSHPAVVSGDEPREKIELVTYFGKRPPGVLHCTTKFCDYGKTAGADEYAQQDVSAPQGHPAEVGRGQGLLELGARKAGIRNQTASQEKWHLLLQLAPLQA